MSYSANYGEIGQHDMEAFEKHQEAVERRKESKKEFRKALRAKYVTMTETSLKTNLQARFPSLRWYKRYHPQGMDGAQQVDIVGESASIDCNVFIELERGRANAVFNVIKAWRYVDNTVLEKPVLLIQIFSPFYYANVTNKRRMKESVFIGQKAEKDTATKLKYRHFGEEYWPKEDDKVPNKLLEAISSIVFP
jgi:hypothetical protein